MGLAAIARQGAAAAARRSLRPAWGLPLLRLEGDLGEALVLAGEDLPGELHGRGDDYYETLASRYRAIGSTEIDAAARQWLQPDGLTFVVVGERRLVEPQLKRLSLPVEIREVPGAGG